ncbi:tyrosine-type recombinase/integrase [Prosthecomicrobium sp. N25]|uniref:tyrosine-type recombinase/integrase n=1 Tax=Prosthecomicrobium sp. N25 TaxID=3129254 RepID=UPI00307717E2
MRQEQPKVNARGLKVIPRADGSFRLLWRCPIRLVQAGYATHSVNLVYDIRDEATWPLIEQACRDELARAEAWLSLKAEPRVRRGTIAGLCDLYETHEASPYHGAKWNTRRNYDQELGVIRRAWGERRLDALGVLDFHRWYGQARDSVEGGGIRKAHGLIKRVRAIMKFGAAAEVPHARRLHEILLGMRFVKPAPRRVFISFEQVVAVIRKAHEVGRPEIALAQALQFETGLRQSDVIGLWEPCAADDGSPYRTKTRRWVPGLVWQDIHASLVLTLQTSKTGAKVTHALRSMPLVVAELERIPIESRVGPVVVSKATGMPFQGFTFSKDWRRIADAAGVPRDVWNRDSRAGAASEVDEAGLGVEDAQKLLGHTTPKVTQIYVRGKAVVASEKVAAARAARREEKL